MKSNTSFRVFLYFMDAYGSEIVTYFYEVNVEPNTTKYIILVIENLLS